MKVGPVSFPVSNAGEVLGFAILTVGVIAIIRMLPLPASLAKYKP